MPEDFIEWMCLGNDQWSWESVLPYFKKLEQDIHHQSSEHGEHGPLSIYHEKAENFNALQRGFYRGCQQLGFPTVSDFNCSGATGVGGFPKNINADQQRLSTSLAYLTKEVQARSNLVIQDQAHVHRIVMSQGAGSNSVATGVDTRVKGRSVHYHGKRITLSAGVIHSPAILQRSGIGKPQHLRSLGIDPLIDLPAVGQNFLDHPVVSLWAIPKEGVCPIGERTHQAMLRYTSAQSTRAHDMSLFMLSAFNPTMIPALHRLLNTDNAMAVSAVLGVPKSVGRVDIYSADPNHSPKVYANLLQDPEDSQRMLEGVRLAWSVLQQPDMKDLLKSIPLFHPAVIDDDKKLLQMLSTFVRGSSHAMGTARMGSDSDTNSVVNQQGQVHGCANLQVVDASIMPTTVCSSPNLTCIMLAEKIADAMK
jgi:choline dehydrogenase